MIGTIRKKFGPVAISIVVGLIAFVFIFFGVFTPKSTQGIHEGAVAGTVNGEAITISEFNRELNRRMEFFRAIGGGKISDAQLKMFKVKDSVFQELAQRKLLIQEAVRQGVVPSDAEIREKIMAIDAFKKDGRFDTLTYRQILEANRQTPAGFEKLMRDDLVLQKWTEYLRDRVQVSDEEIRREFLEMENQRSIKYVLLTSSSPKAESNEALTPEKLEEQRKRNSALADRILPLLAIGKGADAQVNALLKSSGFEVKTSPLFSQQNRFIPGVGEAPELMKDAFSENSPIDPRRGGKAKKYVSGNWILVALLADAKAPDLSKLETSQAKIREQVVVRKERTIFEGWLKKLSEKAKIERNAAVVNDEEA